jgi:tetratricopeptide (TPR) repeat protein/S1-C subfamily serine protease
MKITVLTALLIATNLLPAIATAPRSIDRQLPSHRLADAATENNPLTPQQIRTHSTQITVRISTENNGGSGVLIGKKATKGAPGSATYLVLTNKHVIGRNTKFQIKTADGNQHTAQLTPNTQINPKYDVALLQFTSTQKYQLADLDYEAGKNGAINTTREIYSAGFPFDSAQLRLTTGKISQLSDVPLEDGTQIGYITDRGEKNLRQGMSGGPVMAVMGDGKVVVVGINTIGAAPLIPSYTYFDGSKPTPKRAAEYTKSNWGVPIYNVLSQLNPEILYQYDRLPKVQRQVTPTGYMAQLNRQARQQTVRIESNDGNGSGVIVAKQGTTYYVLTAKHVVTLRPTEKDPQLKIRNDLKTIAHDQESHTIQPTDITLAEGLDLAIVKFTSTTNYPVAALGNYSPRKDATVFASGFPSRERIDSPLWQWQLNPGKNIANQEFRKFQAQDKFSFESDGYDLIYTSISYGGMSGGGVFDTEGRVVGIHGKVEGDGGSEDRGWNQDLSFGNSLGISIQSFIGLATKLKVSPQLLKTSKNIARDLNASELATVAAVRDSIPQPQADSDAKQWLQYGNQLHRIGKYADAIKAFDIAIAKGGESKWAGYYGKARAFGSNKKYPQALASISTAIANIPTASHRAHYYIWARQSSYYRELKKYPEALKAIDTAIALEPTDRILFSSKASIYDDNRQYQKAIAIYDNLIKVPQPESYLFVSRGKLKLDLIDKSGALSDYNKAIALDPNSTNGYMFRGLFKFRVGDLSGANLDFDKVISLDYTKNLAYSIRGLSKLKLGDKSGALTDIDRAILLDPKESQSYAHRANVKLELGDNKGALLDFNKVVTLDPSDTNYRNRSTFRSQIGDKAGALSDCNTAVSIDPKEPENYQQRGLIKAQFGDYQSAISDYNTAISLDPKKFITYNGRAIARAELGDAQGALSDYNKSILIEPDFVLSYLNRGDLKLKLGDVRGALLDYGKLISLKPKEPNGYIGRGDVKLKLGDKQGALVDYEKAIALAPKESRGYVVRAKVKSQLGNKQGALLDYNTAISLNGADYRNYYARGTLKLELGDKQGALADYDKAIVVAPKEPLAYIGRAVFKIKSGDKPGAILDLSKAILLDPTNPAFYTLRGTLKFESGDRKGGLSDFNKLIVIEPKNDSYYNVRSEMRLALGDKPGAIADCDIAISLNPKNETAYFARGNIKLGLGDRQGAINDYDRVIKINPSNYNAYLNRGTVKFELGDLTAAMVDTDRAIAINPKLSSAYSNRGFFKILNGGERDALADLERAIQLDAKQGESYASRGFIREMSGDKQNAIADYKQAVRLSPQIVSDWKKQSGLIQKSNPKTYQKYQQMIRKLEIGSKLN